MMSLVCVFLKIFYFSPYNLCVVYFFFFPYNWREAFVNSKWMQSMIGKHKALSKTETWEFRHVTSRQKVGRLQMRLHCET